MSTLDGIMEIAGMIGKALKFLSVVGFVGFVGYLLQTSIAKAIIKDYIFIAAMPAALLFFVGMVLSAAETRFADSGVRRYSKILKETYALTAQKRYAEAAEVFTRQAQKELKDNNVLYSTYCKNAFEMWVKAKEPGKALNEARNVLWLYSQNDGQSLKYNSGDKVEDLNSLVSSLLIADYAAEGAVFAGEVNNQLERFGLAVRCAAVPVSKNIFPTSCTDCGANLSHNPYQDTAQCGYCKAIIYPLNQSPEAKQVYANAAQSANSDAASSAVMDAANKLVKPEKRINLPPANPVEKGSPQTFYSNTVSYTVPANWERRTSAEPLDNFDEFFSPDKKFVFGLSVYGTREKEGDIMQEFHKLMQTKPEARVSLKTLSGDSLGIFNLSEGDRFNFKMNSISWESYPPPDSKGETNLLKITMFFPAEEFEQHKQLISDIYGSVRIRK